MTTVAQARVQSFNLISQNFKLDGFLLLTITMNLFINRNIFNNKCYNIGLWRGGGLNQYKDWGMGCRMPLIPSLERKLSKM